MTADGDMTVLPCERSFGCEQCLTNTTCMFCQSTGKCLPFPVPRLGMVPWSVCPPNLSSLYWYSCGLSYAYILALAIAIFVFVCLLLFLCVCIICVMRRRRHFQNHTFITAGVPADVVTRSTHGLRSYRYAKRFIRTGFSSKSSPETDQLLNSTQLQGSYGPS